MRAILTYHSIDGSGSPISCTPDTFTRHVRWFTSGRVQVTSIERLIRLPASVDAVALTFDDGFVNFQDLAAPLLMAGGLPVTLFVVSDQVGRTNAWGGRVERGIPHLPLLDWGAIARLRDQGVAIGSHTQTHPDLTAVGAAQLEDEVCGSAESIERETGARPDTFAYPYGRVDGRSTAVVARTFTCACTAEFRTLDSTMVASRLPRLDAFYFGQPGLLESWGTPAFERFVRRRRQLRRFRRIAEATTHRMLSLKTNR